MAIYTQRGDNRRTGYTFETTLTPANVKGLRKLFTCDVDAGVYAQPLVVPNVSIGGGIHSVLYVATMNNSVYAFDADDGTQLWENHVDQKPPVPSFFFADKRYSDISSDPDKKRFVGVLSTPVIDAQIDPAGAAPTPLCRT